MYTCLKQAEPDLYAGLALEEALLEARDLPGPVFCIWRSPPALVLGKNQNPWKECDLSLVQRGKLLLGRRISGGGTVYHDPGNLNLAWVMDRRLYAAAEMHAWLREALRQLGFDAATNESGATLVRNHKVSGSAYCYRRNRVLHHVTLLLNANLDLLRASLSPPRLQLKTHAIDSIPAPVANLFDLHPVLTAAGVEAALLAAAQKTFGPVSTRRPPSLSIDKALAVLQSPEWIWGQTPAFTAALRIAGQDLSIHVRKGRVIEVNGVNVPPAPFDRHLPGHLSEILSLPAEFIRRAFVLEGWTWPE